MAGSRKQRASTGLPPSGFAPDALAELSPTEPDLLLPDLPELRTPIAGIGAFSSAAPVEALLRVLPSNTGIAFVVVQHAEPRAKRLAAAALARETSMPVIEARTTTVPKPNHIYIAPSEAAVTIHRDALTI